MPCKMHIFDRYSSAVF